MRSKDRKAGMKVTGTRLGIVLGFMACAGLVTGMAHSQQPGQAPQAPPQQMPQAPPQQAPQAPPQQAPQAPPQQAPQQIEVEGLEDLPDVVARVEGVKVTAQEYKRALTGATQQLRMDPRAQQQGLTQLDDHSRQFILQALIDKEVAGILAKRKGLEANQDEVNQMLTQMIGLPPADEPRTSEEIRSRLEEAGVDISYEELEEQARDMVLMQKLNDALAGDMTLDDAEVQQRYQALKDAGHLNMPKNWDIRHIMIQADPDDEAAMAEAEKEAQRAYERIMNGESFAKVAEEVSDDPSAEELGGLYQGVTGEQLQRMDPKFLEQIPNLQPGEVAEPFQAGDGWHIIKMEQVNEAGTIPYERAEEMLRNQMLASLQQNKVQEIINEAKQDMEIEILLDQASGDVTDEDALEEAFQQLGGGN